MPEKELSAEETEQLSGLTVLEVAGLVRQLEEKWGVSAAVSGPVAAAEPSTSDIEQRMLAATRRNLLTILAARLEILNDADLISIIQAQLQRISVNLDEAFNRTQAMKQSLSHA